MTQNLTRAQIKTITLSSLGGMLEFYEFIIFVFFAKFISNHFFPETLSPFWKLFNTYGIFATGYIVRPLGGVIMAHFGDKFGRKNVFMLSILLMVIPTFSITIIPSYDSIGPTAICLLILVRLCQGIAIGGELPAAWVFVTEHSPENKKAFSLACINSSMTFGILLGAFMGLVINTSFTTTEIYAFAWKIPFFIGAIFGLISVYLRKFLHETPVFKEMQQDKSLSKFPLKDMFKEKNILASIILALLVSWILTACIVVLLLFMPQFMPTVLKISPVYGIYIQITGICALAIGSIVSGLLLDKLNTIKVGISYGLLLAFSTFFYIDNLYSHNIALTISFYILSCFFGGINALTPFILVNIFRARIRYSAVAFSYNIMYAFAGGITPNLVLYFNFLATQDLKPFIYGTALYMIFISILLIICSIWFTLRKTNILKIQHLKTS